MLFPYKDDNPTSCFPVLTWVFIGANCAVFFLLQPDPYSWQGSDYFMSYGFVPKEFFAEYDLHALSTVYTSMFSHGDVWHLLGNMLFLYIYGDNVEDAMGKTRFVLFYLICGTAATLAQGLVDPGSGTPLIGASGAISGIIGSYLLLYPKANVRVFYWFFIFVGVWLVPAWAVLGLWIGEQMIALPESMREAGGVAIMAHLGGFAAGLLLTPFLKSRNIPLFQKQRSRAFARQERRIR